jgi:aryl-alcohol dehydrogenase-like predicted oxidoreductase
VRYRRLGRTELSVSELGFGGGGIGAVYGPTTARESRAAVERALELGVDFFDVAPAYGEGLAERVLGDAVDGARDRVLIETKVALEEAGLRDVRGHVQASVEQSLTRLRTSVVDVLLVHNPVSSERGRPRQRAGDIHMVTAADALAMGEEMQALREEGIVRFLGFTGWRCTRRGLVELLDSGLFDVVQVEYNLLNRSALHPASAGEDVTPLEALEADPDTDMARWAYRPIDQHGALGLAAERDVGVVCIRPLAGGLLTAELDRPEEPGAEMERLHARAAEFATEDGRSLAQAALAFCLAQDAIATVIPGVKNPAELEELARAVT